MSHALVDRSKVLDPNSTIKASYGHSGAAHGRCEERLRWGRTDAGFSVELTRVYGTNIIVERGSVSRLGEIVASTVTYLESPSILIVTDDIVGRAHLNTVLGALRPLGLPVDSLSVHAGEESKCANELGRLWRSLNSLGIQRRTLVIALGGGVICDLVGFVAATYMRGLPYVNVPTSVIAQVDAAIGGKVAADLEDGKNLVGSFHHPEHVVVDPDVLRTLPTCEIVNGLAEVAKVAILDSEPLFRLIEDIPLSKLHLDAAEMLNEIVAMAIERKLSLLSPDPFERSLDRLLNLGHATAHALEAATHYQVYRHGEAVAVGISVATRLARREGLCTDETYNRILAAFHHLGLETGIPRNLVPAVWRAMSVVCRVRNGRLREVVPLEIGQCTIASTDFGWNAFQAIASADRRRADGSPTTR